MALYLNNGSQGAIVTTVSPPYQFALIRKGGERLNFAASIEAGVPTATPERDTWLYDVNGDLLFDSKKQLLEVKD